MRSLALAIAVCLLPGLSAGQGIAPDQNVSRDAQALSVLSSCAATMGSATIVDAYAIGNITPVDGSGGTITTWIKGAAERHDISTGGEQQTYVMNQGSGWTGTQGQHKPVSYALSAYHRPEHAPAVVCILDTLNPRMSILYVGQEVVHNRQLHHIKMFVPPAGTDRMHTMLSQLHVYIDAATLLVVQVQRFVFDPRAYQNFSAWATRYSDYRLVSQVPMPFHVENYLNGQKIVDIDFTDVRVNIGVADAQFQ